MIPTLTSFQSSTVTMEVLEDNKHQKKANLRQVELWLQLPHPPLKEKRRDQKPSLQLYANTTFLLLLQSSKYP